MGKLKKRKQLVLEEGQREEALQQAIKAMKEGRFSSQRRAAEAYGVHYSTLRRRLKGSTSRQKAHIKQQLLSPADEKAIVRWIVRMEEFGFPPRVSHVKEAISLLKGGTGEYTDKIGRNYLTRFLDRHPDLVAKLSSSFDKRHMKASQPETIRKHFSHI